jgi:hypothetical protein
MPSSPVPRRLAVADDIANMNGWELVRYAQKCEGKIKVLSELVREVAGLLGTATLDPDERMTPNELLGILERMKEQVGG